MKPHTYPTAYPDLNLTLARLLTDLRQVLDERFVGLYLHGSLAAGDFTPGRSDVDFLVVTSSELPTTMDAVLAAMHQAHARERLAWADHIEGSYIPREALRRYDPHNATHPALRTDGSFDRDWHASDWILQRHILRERGIVLAGPPLPSLIDPIPLETRRGAAAGILREWWAPMLDDPHRLHDSEYQCYAVLTMCRSLYSLATGEIAGKATAARYAQEQLGVRWAGLIDEALAWRQGTQMNRIDEVLELVRLVVAQSQF